MVLVHSFTDELPSDDRRALILRAIAGESEENLSEEYGVGPSWIRALVEEAKRDPYRKLNEANREYLFRKELLGLIEAG
jgi:DNA-directed RNA polymerase specialized sigma24 family protein